MPRTYAQRKRLGARSAASATKKEGNRVRTTKASATKKAAAKRDTKRANIAKMKASRAGKAGKRSTAARAAAKKDTMATKTPAKKATFKKEQSGFKYTDTVLTPTGRMSVAPKKQAAVKKEAKKSRVSKVKTIFNSYPGVRNPYQ